VVSFRDSNGDEWSHVTAADSLFQAVKAAMDFFANGFGKAHGLDLRRFSRIGWLAATRRGESKQERFWPED